MSRLLARAQTVSRALLQRLARRPGEPAEVRRILVAHNLLLGDTLLLAPLLAKLAARYPDAEKIVLARPAVAPLFSGRPYGWRCLPFDPRERATLRPLFAMGGFDLAFVLGDNRYSWLARAAGARWIVAFAADRPGWKNRMVDRLLPHAATPMAWADMAATLTVGEAPPPYRAGDWPRPDAALLALPLVPFAVLHVGASSPLKSWPAERWRELSHWLAGQGIMTVWSCGRGEEALVDAADPARRSPRHCGDLTLAQLWHLLAASRLLVCPDTGVAHLGRLVGVPTVALFGPGSAEVHGSGRFWRDSPFRAVTVSSFPCRDQAILFRREVSWVRRCQRSPAQCAFAECMAAIDCAAVTAAAAEVINLAGSAGIAGNAALPHRE